MANMKETIAEVAINLFFRKGYFATSMSDIARGCGIQKASIYHHFPGKEDLLFSIIQSTMTDLMAELNQNLRDEANVECRMRSAVRSHVYFHLSHQKETFIASSELRGLSEEHYSVMVSHRDQYERVFQELIEAGIAQDLFQPNDVKILSYAILTLCTAGATWYKHNGRLSAAEIVAIYENFILNGLMKGPFPTARPAELACDPYPI
jgi:AcrR family transcriptional regulator